MPIQGLIMRTSSIPPRTGLLLIDSYAEAPFASRNQLAAYTESCEDSKIIILVYPEVCYIFDSWNVTPRLAYQGIMAIRDMLAGRGGDEILCWEQQCSTGRPGLSFQ